MVESIGLNSVQRLCLGSEFTGFLSLNEMVSLGKEKRVSSLRPQPSGPPTIFVEDMKI